MSSAGYGFLGYGYLLEGDCAAVFAAAGSDRRKMLHWFENLAGNPNRNGDYEEVTPAGRRVQVTLFEEWLISYWVDHAVKRVCIVEVMRVGGG